MATGWLVAVYEEPSNANPTAVSFFKVDAPDLATLTSIMTGFVATLQSNYPVGTVVIVKWVVVLGPIPV